MEFPIVIKLTRPVELETTGGEKRVIKEISIARDIEAGDCMDLPATEDLKVGDLLKLTAEISGEPMLVIKKIKPPDLFEVTQVVHQLLAVGQVSGEKELPGSAQPSTSSRVKSNG